MARKISIHKFQTTTEVQAFVDGGIIGSPIPDYPFDLVGKTLIFTSPSAVTVTFVAGANPAGLSYADIKTQVEAAIATVRVMWLDKRLVLVEVTPSSGVALNTTGTAKATLGFNAQTATTGRVISQQGGAAPNLMNAYMSQDNFHVLYIGES